MQIPFGKLRAGFRLRRAAPGSAQDDSIFYDGLHFPAGGLAAVMFAHSLPPHMAPVMPTPSVMV